MKINMSWHKLPKILYKIETVLKRLARIDRTKCVRAKDIKEYYLTHFAVYRMLMGHNKSYQIIEQKVIQKVYLSSFAPLWI